LAELSSTSITVKCKLCKIQFKINTLNKLNKNKHRAVTQLSRGFTVIDTDLELVKICKMCFQKMFEHRGWGITVRLWFFTV
jgi:hypothetical protein